MIGKLKDSIPNIPNNVRIQDKGVGYDFLSEIERGRLSREEAMALYYSFQRDYKRYKQARI